MSQNVFFVFAVTASVGLNLLAGYQYLKSKKSRNNRFAAAELQRLPVRHESSLFPEDAALKVDEVLSPLIEAEVYFVYGRRHDAEAVLASGLRAGRITPDDVSRLREKLNAERQIELSPAT